MDRHYRLAGPLVLASIVVPILWVIWPLFEASKGTQLHMFGPLSNLGVFVFIFVEIAIVTKDDISVDCHTKQAGWSTGRGGAVVSLRITVLTELAGVCYNCCYRNGELACDHAEAINRRLDC
jgi:hypothetical protein